MVWAAQSCHLQARIGNLFLHLRYSKWYGWPEDAASKCNSRVQGRWTNLVGNNLDRVFIHNLADVATGEIGDGTKIWQFVVVLAGAKIGAECNICANVLIEGDVVVGDRVTVKCGVQLWDGLRVGNDVFIGPNATFTNDLFPRSKQRLEKYLQTVIEDGASIGAGAVILPGLVVGQGAMVGAGAVVTRSVAARSLVLGNPAKHVRFVAEGGGRE